MTLSTKNQPDRSRRRFIALGLTGAGSATLWALGAGARRADASAAERVVPSSALAKALGYTENATTVNRSQFPTYKPGDMCSKCRFYKGKAGAAWGPCQIFMSKDVNAKGWCASFAMKT